MLNNSIISRFLSYMFFYSFRCSQTFDSLSYNSFHSESTSYKSIRDAVFQANQSQTQALERDQSNPTDINEIYVQLAQGESNWHISSSMSQQEEERSNLSAKPSTSVGVDELMSIGSNTTTIKQDSDDRSVNTEASQEVNRRLHHPTRNTLMPDTLSQTKHSDTLAWIQRSSEGLRPVGTSKSNSSTGVIRRGGSDDTASSQASSKSETEVVKPRGMYDSYVSSSDASSSTAVEPWDVRHQTRDSSSDLLVIEHFSTKKKTEITANNENTPGPSKPKYQDVIRRTGSESNIRNTNVNYSNKGVTVSGKRYDETHVIKSRETFTSTTSDVETGSFVSALTDVKAGI